MSTPYDFQYDLTDDPNTDQGSGSVIQSLFDSAAQVGTAYFNSQTPQTVPVSPYGPINPATGQPYNAASMAGGTSPLIWLLILGAVGYFAFTRL